METYIRQSQLRTEIKHKVSTYGCYGAEFQFEIQKKRMPQSSTKNETVLQVTWGGWK